MIVSQAENAANGMMMLLLVLCAVVIMIVLLRRQQFRSTSRRDMARDHVARIREQRGLHQSMDELLLQLEDMSRRIGAQVDTKFAKLETVIRDADERIARLEAILGQSDTKEKSRKPRRAASRRDTPVKSAPDPAPPSIGKPAPAIENTDPRFAHVYALADGGTTPIEIAKQLDMPLGEVELILNLRKIA